MPLSIRSRLLLLLLSVLLPGMLSVAWLIATTFEAEHAASVRNLRQNAYALATAVDNEVARRATIAHLLAGSRWLQTPGSTSADDLAQFRRQASSGIEAAGGWVELRDAERVLVDTRSPQAAPRQHASGGRAAVKPLSMAPGLEPREPDAAADGFTAAWVQPVQRRGRVVYDLAVGLQASELQRLIDSQPVPFGSVDAILDSTGALIVRRHYADRVDEHDLSGLQPALFAGREEGPFQTHSSSGERIDGYFRSGTMGLLFVSVMPSAELTGPWPGAVLRIAVAALALLLLALTGGLWLASRITRPLTTLKDDARRLQTGQPVTFATTGIVECDQVAAAMVQASSAIRHARHELESQVVAAVARTRSAEQVNAQSQRVEALGRLTGGVAHDFNNLLGIISNSLHLVERHPVSGEVRVPIETALRAVETGSQLTQHLLRFAGRRPTRPQRVFPTLALPDMRELLRSVLGSRIAVSVEVAPDTQPVLLDPGELELALINLTLNARDAMPVGGELQLRARNALPYEATDLPAAPHGHVLISVGDNGLGIEPETLTHVFEPFFTTKAVGKGSGLGLSQVLGFCLQAGGTARVDSTPGIGTTVSMWLPAVAPPVGLPLPGTKPPRAQTRTTAAAAAGAAAPATSEVAGARVLLVEDNDSLAAMTAALLRSHGARVERAADAQAALRALQVEPDFDAVLSDVVMPGPMDGLGLARQLRAQQPQLPVLLISGYNDAAAAAAQEFVLLRKPCPPEEMLSALRTAIGPPEARVRVAV